MDVGVVVSRAVMGGPLISLDPGLHVDDTSFKTETRSSWKSTAMRGEVHRKHGHRALSSNHSTARLQSLIRDPWVLVFSNYFYKYNVSNNDRP